MPRSITALFHAPRFYALLFLSLLLLMSFQLRDKEFNSLEGAPNIVATYHTLLTITALDESSAAHHWYLPTVSLGREIDKNIPWGATVPTSTGDYLYTSFYSPGFVAPYLWFKALGLSVTERHLALFNLVLGCISALVLFFLLHALLRHNGFSESVCAAAAVVGCSIALFSREALLSQGVIYWCHSLWQPMFIGALFCYLKYQTGPTQRSRTVSAVALVLLAFAGALTEWTGYLFNAGLVALLWFDTRQPRDSRALAIKVFVITALAMVVMLTHFMLALGFRHTLGALLLRFMARNASSGSVSGLIGGYGQSYGLFLIAVLIILAIAHFSKYHYASDAARRTTITLLLAAAIPLSENLLLLNHATAFSFDRLKFIPIAALLIALAFANYKTIARLALLILITASALQNYKTYRADMNAASSWGEISREDKRLAADVINDTDPDCTVFASSFEVRAYANLLFHHGIYENVSVEDAVNLLHTRHGCALIYLEGQSVFDDLPAYTRVTIARETGEIKTLVSLKNSQLPAPATGQTTTPSIPPAAMP